jgi:hypothetical protein
LETSGLGPSLGCRPPLDVQKEEWPETLLKVDEQEVAVNEKNSAPDLQRASFTERHHASLLLSAGIV